MKRLLLTTMTIILCAGALFAQQKITVTGTVLDDKGQPVAGVGVIQKGTTNGAATDLDGKYSITLDQGALIEFSSIGYTTKELKADQAVIDVTLSEDNQILEETVVIGYGVQKKSDLTGSISQVGSDDISNRTITNAEQALQGKTAGVMVFNTSAKPGSSGTIRIRGISSNGSSDPLYVVDGNISNDISNIDPSDIESMEVLKDGASAAIYGARAGNGVILITTKKGKGNGKISYDFQLTSQRIGKMPKVMNSKEYMQYYLEDGRFTQSMYDANWDGKTDTDWLKESFEHSLMTHHTLNFQSGSDKGSLYISLSYMDNNGMMKGDNDRMKRITGMINASWKFKPWFEITTNNQITHFKLVTFDDNNSGGGNPILSAIQLDPLTAVTYPADNLPANMQAILDDPAKGELLGDGKGNYYGVSNFMTNGTVNPWITRNKGKSTRQGSVLNGSTAFNLTPIKGLVITSRLGYRIMSNENYGYNNDYYANANSFQNWGSVSASAGTPTYWQWENFVNYNKSIKKFDFSVMVGTSYNQRRSFDVSGSYTGAQGDFGFKYDDPRFFYFAYANASATKTLTGGEAIKTRNWSYFGRLTFNYARKYLLQASLRADAADSSVLPSGNKWGYFPAVSLGWTVSEENFMQPIKDWFSFLKIRASWGQNGSTASLGNYLYSSVITSPGVFATGYNPNSYGTAYTPSSTGNDKLKWETSEQTNVGVDARFFSGKLSFSADYFMKKTKDLIVTGTKPSSVIGVTVSPMNGGNVENSGFEFELKWQDKIGEFGYSVSANLATLKNRVTYVEESLGKIDGAEYLHYGAVTRFEKGKPAWYFYGYKYKGVNPETGNAEFVDTNNDGQISNEDKTNIGSGIPKVTYGITLSADWKNFDLRVFGAGAGGQDLWCMFDRSDYAVNKFKCFTDKRWTSSNHNASQPRAGAANYNDYLVSSGTVFKGNYFKIKQIQLGYNLPSSLLKKIRIERLRIYGSLDDFFTITNYPGFDPEISGNGSYIGIDRGSYPNSKKIVFGVNLSF